MVSEFINNTYLKCFFAKDQMLEIKNQGKAIISISNNHGLQHSEQYMLTYLSESQN